MTKEPNLPLLTPAATKVLSTLDAALYKGMVMRSFLSGGGCRVVTVATEPPAPQSRETMGGQIKQTGYGDSATLDEALVLLAKDYSGKKDKKNGMYLTGTTQSPSLLDRWHLSGAEFRAWYEAGHIRVDLLGYAHTEFPQDLIDRIISTGRPELWADRDRVYEGRPFTFPGNGEAGTSWQCIQRPSAPPCGWCKKNNTCTDKSLCKQGCCTLRDTDWRSMKTGYGEFLKDAFKNAWDAPAQEYEPND